MEKIIQDKEQENIEQQAAIFAALSDPTRLRLVKHLCRECHGESVCVNYLAAMLEITASAVSQHLKVLKNAGLVMSERRGYYVHYRINPEALSHCQRLSAVVLTVIAPDGKISCQQNCRKGRQ